MVRILMLDLGGTLIDEENQVFAYVQEVLQTLRGFETKAHKPLSLCLVSDYFMPTPQKTVKALFQKYVALLESLDLARFFEPVERRVTLSTHAGVTKPDRQIFELAIKRLGLKAKLEECLFISENAQHIAACRSLGIKTLEFDPTGSRGDFSDWSEAPLLVAHHMDQTKNLEPALKLRLSVAYDLEFVHLTDHPQGGILHGQARVWQSLPSKGKGPGPKVPLSVGVEIKLDSMGRVVAAQQQALDPEQLSEAALYLETLDQNRQIAHGGGPLSPGETHRETVTKKGEKRIKRERFSSI